MIEQDYDHEGGRYDELYDQINVRHNCRTWSPSSTKVFLGCRLQYFFQYVKGWSIRAKSPALSLGTSFHAAAEAFNRARALGKGDEVSPEDLFEVFDKSWEQETKGMEVGKHYKDQGELDTNRQKGLDLIEKYQNSRTRRAYTPALYTPPYSDVFVPAVELKVDVPFVNLHTGRLHSSDHRLTGIIDLVSVANKATTHFDPNDLMVLDYKTIGREWDQFSIDTNLQLLMYSYAMRYLLRNENWFAHLKKDREDLVGLVCLIKQKASKESNKWGKVKHIMVRITDNEIEYLERLLLKCINDLSASGDQVENFLPNPQPDQCRICEYQEPCLMVRRGARNQDMLDWAKMKGLGR